MNLGMSYINYSVKKINKNIIHLKNKLLVYILISFVACFIFENINNKIIFAADILLIITTWLFESINAKRKQEYNLQYKQVVNVYTSGFKTTSQSFLQFVFSKENCAFYLSVVFIFTMLLLFA